MTSSDDPATQTPDTDAPEHDPSQRRLRRAIGLVLVLALVALAALLVWMLLQRSGDPDAEQRDREEVMAQAEQFMIRVNTYGPDLLEGEQMPDYRDQVSAVITPRFDTDFLENVPANEQVVAQSGLSRTCEVFATGVSVIDDDSATALVAGAFVNSYPEAPGATTRVDADPASFRVEVQLVKTRGTWLVDDFDPVTGAQAGDPADPTTSPDPTELPSPNPSDAPYQPSGELPAGPDDSTGPTIAPSSGAAP